MKSQTKAEYKVVARRESCAICHSSDLAVLLDHPGLPLTGIFSQKPMEEQPSGIDQQFLFCSACGHGQLAFAVDPSHLYDETYIFRTSLSATARAGTDFFLNFLKSIRPQLDFQCALDIGCNDLYLLKQLQDKVPIRVGIDPMWAAQPLPDHTEGIGLIGGTLEEADVMGATHRRPDLVVCRHTLEHIFDPRQMLEKLVSITSDQTLFVFELPGLDTLMERSRFDQIFHQHLQYFSLHSLCGLMRLFNLHLIDYQIHYHDWGAMAVAFSKQGRSAREQDPPFRFDIRVMKDRFKIFQQHLQRVGRILDSFKDSVIYGYGASAMLPILAYHMQHDLGLLQAVLDDDIRRAGLYYANLPLRIHHPSEVKNFTETNIFLTAVDSVEPILTKLMASRPKNIIFPLEAM